MLSSSGDVDDRRPSRFTRTLRSRAGSGRLIGRGGQEVQGNSPPKGGTPEVVNTARRVVHLDVPEHRIPTDPAQLLPSRSASSGWRTPRPPREQLPTRIRLASLRLWAILGASARALHTSRRTLRSHTSSPGARPRVTRSSVDQRRVSPKKGV